MIRENKTLTNRSWVFGLCFVLMFSLVGQAGEIRLKNGTVLKGNISLMERMGGSSIPVGRKLVPKDAPPTPQNIVLIDNGWQKYYVPRRQIPDEEVDKDIIPSNPQTFLIPQITPNQGRVIASVGSIINATPFDMFGHRTVSLMTQKGRLDVVQVITRIEPDHVVLDAREYNWRVGVSLSAVPRETLDKLLRQKIKEDDVAARFGLVRFYTQAEFYPEAFAELDAIVARFPDQQARADIIRAELMDYFGRQVLQELSRRKAAGQHQLAYDYATKLQKQKLGGAVLDDVRKYIREYDEMVKSIERAKILLADWQAKLKEPRLIEQLQPLRTEINEQLNVEILPRLDAFLQGENDKQLTPEQHLALAYSGWVVGAANAMTDLDLAIRYWDARFHMLEALRADSVQTRDQSYQELRHVEGVGPKAVLQLTSLLPPIQETVGIRPGQPHRVQVTAEGQTPAIAYSVLLPPEYSPFHSYPLLVALRSRGQSYEQTLEWWGGSPQAPGPAMRRGYIVIAPEYIEERQTEYTYSATSHQVVIESLRDARKRFSVDSNRVFLSGHGIGADAAFDLGMAHPDEFAGIIPIGGECQHYPKLSLMNGRFTAWYVIGRGFSMDVREGPNGIVQRDPANNAVFDEIFKYGFQFDFTVVEYLGRGVDRYLDEVPKLFEWMDLHVRRPVPKDADRPNDFEIVALRKTDNRYFWLTAIDLPWTAVLPAPQGASTKTVKMTIQGTINEGNKIRIGGPAKHYLIRLAPESVDFDKRVEVLKDGKRLWSGFVTPEATAILNELRQTGDRTRLPLAVLDVK
jgi:enterochelin esterase-like enzyme